MRLTIAQIKEALSDERFRESLPPEFADDLAKWRNNPGCGCNQKFYRRLMADAREQLQAYFPGAEITAEPEAPAKPANHWRVINCRADELEGHLRKLGDGRKQIAVARYEDQVTVVVNDLDR